MIALRLVVVALLAALAAACSAPAPSPQAPRSADPISPVAVAPADAPTVTVDRLALDAVPLLPLGLTADRRLAVPPVEQPQTVGYYRFGPRPGAPGPAVILGHVNGGGRPGAFARLDTMRPGDQVTTSDAGLVTTFRVRSVERVPKERFPTARVYSDTAYPELRLITCGGAFNGEDYADNVIVFAEALP